MYRLALFNQANRTMPIKVLQSPTPFHAIVQGQKIWFPPAAPAIVVDVTHEFTHEAGADWFTMQVLV